MATGQAKEKPPVREQDEKVRIQNLSIVADEILDFIATKNINFEDFKVIWDLVIKKSFKRFSLSNKI